ncbi:hypothetical protein PTKIN_Ptkin07bG0241400 [Pterospermum kingtungense]
MGFSESERRCKNHPHHQEKQGVCPSCLRERLSRLCSASPTSPLSFSPADDNSLASSSHSASPAGHHKRNGSWVMGIMGMGSLSFKEKLGTKGLKKSRSVAVIPRDFDDEEVKNGKKKKGFWSKLLGFKRKNNKDVLTHSTSMKLIIERVNLVS